MINYNDLLPMFEAYVIQYIRDDFDLNNCEKKAVIEHLRLGYTYVRTIYTPKTINCGCFRGINASSNKIMYIYIFEFAYSMIDGKLSFGKFEPSNTGSPQIIVENYVKSLIASDGNGDY